MGKLDGKVAWVTGGGSGIGLAGARALASTGATVVMSGRREAVLAAEASRIRDEGGQAEIEPLDVADHQAVKQVAERILSRHGRVNILLNSAGVNTPNRSWKSQTVEGWRNVVGINLDGAFYTVHAVLPAMRAQKDGLIINVEERARMLQPDDLGQTIRFIAELPAHVCINQLIISPTWNRMYVDDL